MKPEKTRLKIYKMYYELKGKHKEITKIDNLTKAFYYNTTDDIKGELIVEILTTINCVHTSITHDNMLEAIEFHFLDDHNLFIIIKPKEDSLALFLGRKMNNLFALKRLISNINGKLRKHMGGHYNITIDVAQLLK